MSRKNNEDRDIEDFVAESSTSLEISDPKVMSDSWRQELVCDPVPYNNMMERESENLNREEDEVEVKEIVVDTFEVTTNNATERTPPLSPSPSPRLLSATTFSSERRSFPSVGKLVANNESDDLDKVAEIRSRHKNKTLERKVSDVAATAISSFYNHTKQNTKKKKKRKIRRLRSHISDDTTYSPQQTQEEPRQTLIVPPPPPPPPPPFPSVFKNLFKKGGKHNNNNNNNYNKKRIHSIPLPPPLPPPPSSIFHNIFKTKSKRFHLPSSPNALFKINGTKTKRFNHITNSSPPIKSNQLSEPQPKILEPQIQRSKTSGYYDSSGSQSPLFPMPPPPPPFKMSDMMFEVRGDFVKVESTHSSLCSSPDHDQDLSLTIIDDGPICFPSPDVNAKADHFISRLKDEWRMERINCVKDKLP